jgi:predicted HTH transcriptional regulator
MIIEYIKNNGSVSNKEARELLSLADSTTKRVLKKMVNDGLLEVKGEKKSSLQIKSL